MWKVGCLKHWMTPFRRDQRDRRRVPPGLVFEQPSHSFSILACPGPARDPLYNKNYNLVGFGDKNYIKITKNRQNRHLFARNRRFCRKKPPEAPGREHHTAAVATGTLLLWLQGHCCCCTRYMFPFHLEEGRSKHFRADLQNTWVWAPGMALARKFGRNEAQRWG